MSRPHVRRRLPDRRLRQLPGSLLRTCFAMTRPVRNLYGKFAELSGRIHDEEFFESFAALEAWANAPVTVAGELFRDIVKSLYRRNELGGAGSCTRPPAFNWTGSPARS